MYNEFQLHRLFDISLRNTNKLKGKNTFSLIIGANNGTDDDTLAGYSVVFDWKALLIEPLPDHVLELKKNFNRQIKQGKFVVAEECLSDKNETVQFGYIPNKIIDELKLHDALKGMSCILPARNGFFSDKLSKQLFDQYKQIVTFDTKTIKEICDEYFIDTIDYVQCDVEGYDYSVLKEFNFDRYKPLVFKFETRNNDENIYKDFVKLFESNNYSAFKLGGDALAFFNPHLDSIKRNKRYSEVEQLANASKDNIPAVLDNDIDG